MKAFFDTVRKSFGNLAQSQVDGIEFILSATKGLPLRHRAYILATAWHETAKTMLPIAEIGRGKGKKYGIPDNVTGQIYYGRGYVQLTWKDNYAKAQRRLKELGLIDKNVDFVKNPDFVMKPSIAAAILVVGMTEGWFTNKKLADFDTFVAMRKIVNGTDKDMLIANYASVFELALEAIKGEPEPVEKPIISDAPKVEDKPTIPSKTVEKSIAAWIIGAILVAFAALGAWMTGGN